MLETVCFWPKLTRKSTPGYRYAGWEWVDFDPWSKFEREYPKLWDRGIFGAEDYL